MSKQSIQIKLTAVLIAVSLIGMSAVFVLNYFAMRNNMLEELLAKTHNMVQCEAQKIDGWFSNQKTFIESVGTSLSAANDSGKALEILRAQAAHNKDYFNIYMGLSNDHAIFTGASPDYSTWKATQRGWYKEAMAAGGNAAITQPYVDAQVGGTVITIARDIGSFDSLNAVLAADLEISTIENIVNEVETYGGYAFLTNQDGFIVAHPNADFNPHGEQYASINDISAYAQLYTVAGDSFRITRITDYDGVSRYIFRCDIKSSGWTLYAAVPSSAVSKAISPDAFTIAVSVVFLIAAALLVSYIVRRMVVRPLVEVVKAGEKLAAGDLNINLATGSGDEMEQLIGQFNTIVEATKMQASILEAISNRDFSVIVNPRSSHDTISIAIKNMVDTINEVLISIKNSAFQVSLGSTQISNGAQSLAQGSTEQTASVEQLSSSISAVSQKTKDNADMATKAASLANTINQNAERGNRQMGEMMDAVKEINHASQSISNVIKVIDDIAFQTNILALNAAVEAARAGQHGKGFAVVAAEVRNLAAKSAEAAKETGELIVNSMEKAELGARIANETAASLADIVSGITESSRIVGSIAKSSEEQSLAISHINMGIEQVAQVVQQNSATAEESAAASKEMSEQANILEELITQFKLNDVNKTQYAFSETATLRAKSY